MMRLMVTTCCVLWVLGAVACGDSTEGPGTDTAMSFPTADTQGPGLPNDTDTPTDTTPSTPGDTTPAADTWASQDTAPTPDTAVPPTPEDTSVPDTVKPQDTAMPDAGPQDTASPDTGNPNQGPCNPVGTWLLDVSSAALPGEGCGEDGSNAQGNKQQVLIVSKGPGNTFSGILKDNDDPPPDIELTVAGQKGACKMSVSITVAVSVPGAGDVEGGVASLQYQYDVNENEGTVQGKGGVTTAFVTDSNKVIAECTEPIDLKGMFQPQ